MSLLHRQIPRFQVPPFLLPLWERDSALAFDLYWPCYLYYTFRGPRPNYTGLDLSDWDLRKAFLWGADLSGANLSGANLEDANFFRANLQGANLQGANLVGANLEGTNLSWTNLSWTNLSGANLFAADLFRTNLSEADLSGAYRSNDPPSGWKIVRVWLQQE